MGTITITGCVKIVTENQHFNEIVFDDFPCGGYGDSSCSGPADIKPRGCIITSGEHAGMVAISLNNPNCDDVYYGCLHSDGTFKIEVPDDCCYAPGNCYACAATPYQIVLTFSGINFIECDPDIMREKYQLLFDPNKVLVITQDLQFANNYCGWFCVPDPEYYCKKWLYPSYNCQGTPTEKEQLTMVVGLYRDSSQKFVYMKCKEFPYSNQTVEVTIFYKNIGNWNCQSQLTAQTNSLPHGGQVDITPIW
ncbi:MAG: hypothetical protein A2Y12_08860 [Planctomycetes bacterium GWF2_42_9]|nr:MAG: hypothetical protein A2Y12_08860 [Planctomycetes bacterium GWF2_42_9]HAL45508.1 hypothetical protein [Phycisphaerales bacterium]